jgi:hypothetical protein
MGQIRIKHVVLFFLCVLCVFTGERLFRNLLTAGTLHHAVHIEFCRTGDKELLRNMPPDVVHYAMRTSCAWAPARWLLQGAAVALLYMVPVVIVFYWFKRGSRR